MEEKSLRYEIQEEDGIVGTKESQSSDCRRKSLFETEVKEGLKTKDVGCFVLAHADFPLRARSWSHPLDLTRPSNLTCGFEAIAIKDIIKKILQEKIGNKSYDPKICAVLARDIAEKIKEKVSELKVPTGFKVVCTCIISERLKPRFSLESGFAWEDGITTVERDKFAEYVYNNDTVVAVGTVYVVDCKKVDLELRKRSRSLRDTRPAIPAAIPE